MMYYFLSVNRRNSLFDFFPSNRGSLNSFFFEPLHFCVFSRLRFFFNFLILTKQNAAARRCDLTEL